MDEYEDRPPTRLTLLVGGAVFFVAVSEFTGVASVVSAFAASATGGTVGPPFEDGLALIDEAVEFLIGVGVATAVLAVILAVTGGFEECSVGGSNPGHRLERSCAIALGSLSDGLARPPGKR